ncbi:MAG: hypothetical protein R3F43_23835 [bacterium]
MESADQLLPCCGSSPGRSPWPASGPSGNGLRATCRRLGLELPSARGVGLGVGAALALVPAALVLGTPWSAGWRLSACR